MLNQNIMEDSFLEIISPNEQENKVLNELNDSYHKIVEMTEHERQFLNSLILRNKPRKLLELGVSRGGSSIVMLNAIKDIDKATLYSIDKLEKFYGDRSINVGDAVSSYSSLRDKWKLYTGGLPLEFMDEIGSDIDFCLIDTMHINPGEILDFLTVLPYLKDDAIVVFHDTNLHSHIELRNSMEWAITNNLLMSAIYGKKFIQGNFVNNNTEFSNIGAIKLTKETRQHVWEIFNLLTIKWKYALTDEEFQKIIAHFKRFYNTRYINYFKKVICFHLKRNA